MGRPSTVINRAPANQTKSSISKPLIGSMVIFQYEATTSKKLPYWDRFPLVFPFQIVPNGMYGINLHYLPPVMRAQLMDAIISTADGPLTTPETQLRLTYDVLQASSRNRFVKPCVKHYLNKGLASNLVVIPATEWSVALFLPLERFQKATSNQVYEDSRRIIKGN
jgi:hypothetical protein